MKTSLFTVIISNYNQEKYIYEAIDSVLNQSYKNIEIIITDDCSVNFPNKDIEEYIKSNSNISYQFVINDNNLGTVKTVNKALKIAKGDFVLFFAADDVLYNKNVIKNFVDEFNKHPRVKIISSVSVLYDANMKEKITIWPIQKEINNFNQLSPLKQNRVLKFGPIFAPGATVYRKELFEEIGYLEEKYELIEDWSLFLRLTRLNYKIFIADFSSLKHRGGGVSDASKLPLFLINKIVKDTDLIYKSEVFPKFRKFKLKEKLKILDRYQRIGHTYGIKFGVIYRKYYQLIFCNLDVLFYKLLTSITVFNKFLLPLLCCLIAYYIYILTENIYTLIIGCVILYIVFEKIFRYFYYRRYRRKK